MLVSLRELEISNNHSRRKALTTVTGQMLFLIVITLVFATAMTNWMKGIAGDKMILEQLEIKTAWVKTISTNPDGWEINMIVMNSGTVRNDIEYMTLNRRLIELQDSPSTGIVDGKISVNISKKGEPLNTGETTVLKIWIPRGYESLSSGTSVEIMFKGIGAAEYSKLVKLS